MATKDDLLPPLSSSTTPDLGAKPYPVDYSMHALHRRKLAQRMAEQAGVQPGSIALFQGGASRLRHETDHEPLFRQESSFQYLFGVREPDCYGAITIGSGSSGGSGGVAAARAVLFVPRLPAAYATWMGEILPPSHFKERYGVDECMYVDEMPAALKAAAPPTLYLLCGLNTDSGATAQPAHFDGIDEFVTDKSDTLYNALVECRVIKTPAEVALLAHINNISADAHLEVMRRARPGMMEYQLESMFLHWAYYYGGCRHVSYTSICGCGPNSGVLHYGHAGAPNDRRIGDSDMLLLDMGAEYHCYASDITCSFPASGTFTPPQRVIFEAVAAMQAAVMSAMRPGVAWPDMHALSYRVACERLKEAGVLTGDVDAMMAANVGAVLMPHGLGHLMGLDTHDCGGYPPGTVRDERAGYKSLRCGRALEAGMVITVEPGIYFIDHLLDQALADPALAPFFVPDAVAAYRGSGGVRLEDDVLVTSDGIRNLTNCPRTVEDVEGVMSGRITRRDQLRAFYYRSE